MSAGADIFFYNFWPTVKYDVSVCYACIVAKPYVAGKEVGDGTAL